MILVLRALGLGDLLTGVPALRALRRAHPSEHIVLAAPEELGPLIGMIDAVDEHLPTPGLGRLPGGRRKGARRGARPPHADGRDVFRPDLAVNLHGRGPQSLADLVALDPGAVLSHAHPAFPGVDGPQWMDMHDRELWCRMLAHYGMAADPSDVSVDVPPDDSYAGAVVVHPGAAHAARRWPPDRFAQVAAGLAADGASVLVTGGPDEADLARLVAVSAGLGSQAVLAGDTDVGQLAGIVAAAELVVCGDTGVAHLATACGTPSVVLFGPTPPRLWGPPAGGRHTVLWAGESGDPFGSAPSDGLLRLEAPDVLRAARMARTGFTAAVAGNP